MQRREDWVERLHEALLEAKDKPFAWGQHDCMSFACNMIQAMTGKDLYAAFRGGYSSEFTAAKAIQAAGSEDLESLVAYATAVHDMKEIPVAFAQRGDLVQFDGQDGPAFGIVHLNGVHSIGLGPNGLVRVPTLSAKRAWRV